MPFLTTGTSLRPGLLRGIILYGFFHQFYLLVRSLLTFPLSQDQTQPLELDLTFNLDRLTVAFGTTLPMKDGNPDRKPLSNAIREFADLIWKIGGFRFGHRRTHWDKMKFIYYCCQDADHAYASVAQGKRDTPRMEGFKCRSKLILKPSLEQRTLGISMYHHYHIPYFDCQLSSEVMQFVLDRTATKTPAEIYQDLQSSKPPGWEHAT